MFGLGKTKVPPGAREKIEIAKQMRAAGRFNIKQQGGGGDVQYPSQTIAVTLVYAVTTIIAMVVTGGGATSPLAGVHLTGYSPVDNFITGTDITAFTGDPDEDRVFTILLRGLAFFAMAAVVPLISFGLEKLFFNRKIMPHNITLAVISIIMLFYLCVPADSIAPFFKGIVPFFKSL